MRFVWRSAIVGPMGSAMLLAILFGFSDIWAAVTNPLVGGYWVQLGKALGFVLLLGVAALPFSFGFLGAYAVAIGKGAALLQSNFVRRAMLAGGSFGLLAVALLGILLGQADPNQPFSFTSMDTIVSLLVGTVSGTFISFIWAHVCWLTLYPSAPDMQSNDRG